MSLSLSTRGMIIEQGSGYTFNRHRNSLTGVSLSTGGEIAEGGWVDVLPQYDLEEIAGFEDVKITVYPNGMEQRVATVNAARRQFNLKFAELGSTEVDSLWQFYLDHHGPAYPFVYRHPRDGQSCTVRFSNKTMSRLLFGYQLENSGISLIEVIGE